MSSASDQRISGWLTQAADGWLLAVWVQPGARSTSAQGIIDGCLKLRLAAPPVDGKANEALLRWVADRIGVPVRAVELVTGHTSRRKRLKFSCTLARGDLEARLVGEPLPGS